MTVAADVGTRTTTGTPRDTPSTNRDRPVVAGKFLSVGGRKFYVQGATYGAFRPNAEGCPFPSRDVVARDFALMALHGFNAVRTYTVPPSWLLDTACAHRLRVMVGLPWEQHVAFLDDRGLTRSILGSVSAGVRSCAGHPAVLCYALGNEIPASIVRWHGRRRIERFLASLYRETKGEDPEGLFTYVNYPSTEYLRLPFLDFFCFNVYLESPEAHASYLARLQNLASERPLVMAEIGLDSRRHGRDTQASVLDWQVRTAFASGCAGVFVFAWTDEWHRGGHDIEDWDFGLTTRERTPKPALATVQRVFAEVPFSAAAPWPRVSVVVCTHNGARTLRGCLQGLRQLRYPDFEIIVVDDGSRDQSAAIAREFGVRLVSTENRGLSAARNTGWEAATGEIVAYIDDDASPDPEWLTYLAATFRTTNHVAVGGPNLAPPGDGAIAACVVNAPGGPVHVLFTDREAEHIPGCNMAFRKASLEAVGGFDPQFRSAGDDVDVCWRIQQRGWTIGFHPGAMVWHHRRNSIRNYWRQQCGYGKAEALLERKWPEKYNSLGHISWGGNLYGRGLTRTLFPRQRVYHGPWGGSPFQALHESAPSQLAVLPTMPEWYLVLIALGGLSALAVLWPKLVLIIPFFAMAAGTTVGQAVLSSAQASFPGPRRSWPMRLGLHALTAVLHLLQPLARLWGRARHGLTAWRWRLPHALLFPRPRSASAWRTKWVAPDAMLESLGANLRKQGAVLVGGGAYDRWELEVQGGILGGSRLFMAVEEHGAGKQLFHFRYWPQFSRGAVVAIFAFTGLSVGAALDEYWAAYDILTAVTLVLLGRTLFEAAGAMAGLREVLRSASEDTP